MAEFVSVSISEAKKAFEIGVLTAFEIHRVPLNANYWSVTICTKNKKLFIRSQRSEQPREFKTLEAAVRVLENIGFKVNTLK